MSQCYCDYLTIYNTTTGESFKPQCRSYSCPVHGKRNINILKSRIEYEVSSWESVKMWTFTISSKYFNNPLEHYNFLNKVWRYLITYLRRSNLLSKKQSDFKYIRFPEQHKSGFYHFHVLIDKYIDFHLVYGLWNSFCKLFLETNDEIGGCHVLFIPNSRTACRYAIKYVAKEIQTPNRVGKIYSKSVGIRFFRRRRSSDSFAAYNSKLDKWYGIFPFSALLVSHTKSLHRNYEQFALFELPGPP